MVSIHPHLAEGRIASLLRALRFLNLNPNLNRFLQPGINTIKGSSMFLMGKPVMVAERHRKLARHNVPGVMSNKVPRPGRTLETALFSSLSTVPSGTDFVAWRLPGTLSPANFHGRSATIECQESIYPLQTSKNSNRIKSKIMIKRKMTGLVGCSIAALCMVATVVHAADYDAQVNRWFEVQTNLQSWSGDFTQTRSLKVLSQPLVSAGKVWVKPGEFRWELGQPVQTIVLRKPDQLLILYPRLKRAEKYPLEGVPTGPMKDALALLDASLPRDRTAMEKNFLLLSAAETNAVLQMTLRPRSKSARKFIGEILIGFHTNDFSIAATEMKFADGSSLRNDFTNVVMNRPVDPGLFEAKLPPDYSVVEPLNR